jgi:hypothetical protein
MATVAKMQVADKAFYAHLDDQSGVLAKVNGNLVFMADDTLELTVITPEHINFLVVLGQIGLADAQVVADKLAGGRAWIATHRRNEAA